MEITYFPNHICLVVYRNFHLKSSLLYIMTNGEYFEEIAKDLQNLLNLEIKIKSITSDGDKSSIKPIKKVCPIVPFQRCLVHISRMCRIWLTQHPKLKSGFESSNGKEYRDFINQKSYNIETRRYW